MVTHVVLVNFTAKGVEQVKESPTRASTFIESAQRHGVEIDGLYWTAGHYDGVLLMTAPDDHTASAVTLSLGRGGYVQTQTLRAFDRDGIEAILGKI